MVCFNEERLAAFLRTRVLALLCWQWSSLDSQPCIGQASDNQAAVHTPVSAAINNSSLYLRPGEEVVLGHGRSGGEGKQLPFKTPLVLTFSLKCLSISHVSEIPRYFQVKKNQRFLQLMVFELIMLLWTRSEAHRNKPQALGEVGMGPPGRGHEALGGNSWFPVEIAAKLPGWLKVMLLGIWLQAPNLQMTLYQKE